MAGPKTLGQAKKLLAAQHARLLELDLASDVSEKDKAALGESLAAYKNLADERARRNEELQKRLITAEGEIKRQADDIAAFHRANARLLRQLDRALGYIDRVEGEAAPRPTEDDNHVTAGVAPDRRFLQGERPMPSYLRGG